MNIQMRIITEDNIEQLENMSFSKNINKLLYSSEVTPQSIITEIKNVLNNKKPTDPVPGSCEQTNDQPIEYAETSPAYQPNSFSVITDDSPKYNPEEHEDVKKDSQDILFLSQNVGNTQEEFSPHSPDEPPPFKGGDKVHYRGDKRPERIWSIEKVGDNFITITTEDGYGINPEDKIKVVEPFDLYRENDYSYNLIPTNQNRMSMVSAQENKMYSNSVPAGINFAPVIKINNGGTEYSVDPAGEAHPKISLDNTDKNIPLIEPAKNIVFKKDAFEPSSVFQKEEPLKNNNINESNSGGGGILSGIKDFIIKKLG